MHLSTAGKSIPSSSIVKLRTSFASNYRTSGRKHLCAGLRLNEWRRSNIVDMVRIEDNRRESFLSFIPVKGPSVLSKNPEELISTILEDK